MQWVGYDYYFLSQHSNIVLLGPRYDLFDLIAQCVHNLSKIGSAVVECLTGDNRKCSVGKIPLLFYCFCREMRSPGGSCFPLCNLLKNSVTSGVIIKVNMSLFGSKLFSICVSRSQKCRNVHSQGVYLIMS